MLTVTIDPGTDLETITKEVIVGGIFHLVSGTSLGLGTFVLTYDSSESYRSENVEITVYDGTTFEVVSGATIEVKAGDDILLANSTDTLRSETTDSNG